MLKLKMMLCVMMLPLVVVGCTSAVCQSVREVTHASGVDNAASRLADTAERDAISPQREADHYVNWKEPRSILMSSADRVAHIDGQLTTRLRRAAALPAEYKSPKVIKPSNPFTNVCWGFCFNNTFCAATNFAASTVFFCPIPERRNDG